MAKENIMKRESIEMLDYIYNSDPSETEPMTYYRILRWLYLLLIFYFMYISLALTNQKNIFKKIFKVSIFKAHYVLLTYLINLIVLGFFSFILFYRILLNSLRRILCARWSWTLTRPIGIFKISAISLYAKSCVYLKTIILR